MSIWSQGRTHYMKPLYNSAVSNKRFAKKFFRRKREALVTHTKIGQYETSQVLEFWGEAKNKPEFFLGKWKLGVILKHLDAVKKFVDS